MLPLVGTKNILQEELGIFLNISCSRRSIVVLVEVEQRDFHASKDSKYGGKSKIQSLHWPSIRSKYQKFSLFELLSTGGPLIVRLLIVRIYLQYGLCLFSKISNSSHSTAILLVFSQYGFAKNMLPFLSTMRGPPVVNYSIQ